MCKTEDKTKEKTEAKVETKPVYIPMREKIPDKMGKASPISKQK